MKTQIHTVSATSWMLGSAVEQASAAANAFLRDLAHTRIVQVIPATTAVYVDAGDEDRGVNYCHTITIVYTDFPDMPRSS